MLENIDKLESGFYWLIATPFLVGVGAKIVWFSFKIGWNILDWFFEALMENKKK